MFIFGIVTLEGGAVPLVPSGRLFVFELLFRARSTADFFGDLKFKYRVIFFNKATKSVSNF